MANEGYKLGMGCMKAPLFLHRSIGTDFHLLI